MLFVLWKRAQQIMGTPVGESPTMVITSEPYSQIRCVVVIQGAKRVDKVTPGTTARSSGENGACR